VREHLFTIQHCHRAGAKGGIYGKDFHWRNARKSDRFDRAHFGNVVAQHIFNPVLQCNRR
jgi:hypothetical protein